MSKSFSNIKLSFLATGDYKKIRTEWDSNPECPALESSTLNITPEKTAHFVEHYSPNNS